MSNRAIYWFRNNLRLKDNPSLIKAVNEVEEILLVYIINKSLFESNELGFKNCGKYRWRFLAESILNLKGDLQLSGSDLLLLQGDPVIEITKLAEEFEIYEIYTSKAVDYYEMQEEKALSLRFNVYLEYDQLLLDIEKLPFELRKLPFVFTDFRKTVEKNFSTRKEFDAPEKIPTYSTNFSKTTKIESPFVSVDHRSVFPFNGGERQAWKRLNHYIWNTGKLSSYKYARNGLIGYDYSSKFSPYLAVGSISPVSIYHEIKKYEKQKVKNISTYWLIFELLWREYFKLESLKFGRQIFMKNGILKKDRSYSNNMDLFYKWMNGATSNNFVDANMRELKHTGFMSNRGRQNTASYLAHDLDIDWRWGAAYFESQLIDYDCASNWCNWMYVAGVGNDPRSRKFNTKLQADKYDPKGTFRNLWLQQQLF